jgi:hypothetical protein
MLLKLTLTKTHPFSASFIILSRSQLRQIFFRRQRAGWTVDHVLLTLGNLLGFFQNQDGSQPGNEDVKKGMVASIEEDGVRLTKSYLSWQYSSTLMFELSFSTLIT